MRQQVPEKVSRTERTSAALSAALAKNKQASDQFAAFPRSHREAYVDWIESAKKQETRDKRIAEALETIAKGRRRS